MIPLVPFYMINAKKNMTNKLRGSTISRVLDILEQIGSAERPVTASELNGILNMPKSSGHRLCGDLEKQGFLQKHIDGKRYMPGPRLQHLAVNVLSHSQLRAERRAILSALSHDIGETCNLSYPDGLEMVYADRVETKWPLRLQLGIGTRVPLYCTSAGKMYLSSLRKKKRHSLIHYMELKPHTPLTIINKEQLLEDLKQIRRQNFSVDTGEYIEGMIAIAAPIRDKNEKVCSTISFQGPLSRMSLDRAKSYAPRLHEAADQLAELVDE